MAAAVLKAPEVIEREKIAHREAAGFWAGKTPCWETCHCPQMIREECPATKYPGVPCWEIEGTYCKLDNLGTTGTDTGICQICRVYKRWGGGEPIRLRLFGKGIDTSLRSLAKMAEREAVKAK